MGSKRLNLTGQRFGRLVAQESVLNISHSGKHIISWKCQCDCGNTCYPLRGSLRSGTSNSCGCLQSELISKRRRSKPYESLYKQVKEGALRKGILFDLTYEDFVSFTKQRVCHYCDTKVQWAEFNTGKNKCRSNLDRVDNSIGYSVDNCVVACHVCNFMKRDLSRSAFIKQATLITRHCGE